MCHFISAVLPHKVNVEKVRRIMIEHGRKLEPQPNRSLEEQLGNAESCFLTTPFPCDCGATLGYAARVSGRKAVDLTREVAEFQRKGWSNTKIERWRADKLKTELKPRLAAAHKLHDNDDWANLIDALLNAKMTPYVGLLLHWYSGPLSGRIALEGEQAIHGAAMRLEGLANMQDAVLYRFFP